jgi:hypothetical protein
VEGEGREKMNNNNERIRSNELAHHIETPLSGCVARNINGSTCSLRFRIFSPETLVVTPTLQNGSFADSIDISGPRYLLERDFAPSTPTSTAPLSDVPSAKYAVTPEELVDIEASRFPH